MAVRRIVANISSNDPAKVASFYSELLGLDPVMDLGWIVTLQDKTQRQQSVQLSVATEGGSGTAVPDLSIEVDDLDDVYARAQALDVKIEYGPVEEPWGVQRFFVRDPAGTLINILNHTRESAT